MEFSMENSNISTISLFDNAEQLVTYEQLSQWLGVSRRTLEKYVHRREIPFIKFNSRTIRFRVGEIKNWLQSKSNGANYGR